MQSLLIVAHLFSVLVASNFVSTPIVVNLRWLVCLFFRIACFSRHGCIWLGRLQIYSKEVGTKINIIHAWEKAFRIATFWPFLGLKFYSGLKFRPFTTLGLLAVIKRYRSNRTTYLFISARSYSQGGLPPAEVVFTTAASSMLSSMAFAKKKCHYD